jgi:hypothetical protein
LAVALVVCAAMSGCTALDRPVTLTDPQAIASRIKVTYDDFKKVTIIEGPNCARQYGDMLFLRGWKYASGEEVYQIYLADNYSGQWRFYDSAYDLDGQQFKVTRISRDVDSCASVSCDFTEHLGLTVTKDYLRKNMGSVGIAFKVYGKAGEEVFDIPAAYVQAFLASIN